MAEPRPLTTSARRIRWIVASLVTLAAIGFAGAAVHALRLGVSAHDPWLFPVLVVLPSIVATGLALSLFASHGVRANIIMAGIATFFALYALEGVLEFLPPSGPSMPPATAADGKPRDTRGRFEVVIDLRADGEPAFPSFGERSLRSTPPLGPGITIDGRHIAPLAQLRDKVLVDCNEGGQFSVFHTDERGFNNPPGSWHQSIEVAAVGDSYVQGSCVSPEDNLVAGIRHGIAGTVGLGLGDSGPLVMLGMIKEYLTDVRPRHVIWFFYEGNDLRNLEAELRDPALRGYLDPAHSQGLLELQNRIDTAIAAFANQLLDQRVDEVEADAPAAPQGRSPGQLVRSWVRMSRLRATLRIADVGSRLQRCCDLGSLAAAFEEADRTVSAWGGTLHIVYLPAAGRYAHRFAALLDDDLRYRRRVLEVMRATGVPVLDIDSVFRANGDPTRFSYSDRSHFNPEGYRLVADAVLRHLGAKGR